MNPVLFKIGDFTVAWYGVLMTAGIALGAYIAQKLAAKRGLDSRLMGDLAFWAIVWGVIGARLAFVILTPEAFHNPTLLDYINIRNGGLSVHGALIAGMFVGLYYKFRYRLDFYRYGDLFAPMFGLGIVGGRLGNIMNGSDTPGRVTGWPIGFQWPETAKGFHDSLCNPNAPENLIQYCVNGIVTAPVHFTQLYGVFIGLAIFGASFLWLRSKRPGWTFWQAILWYSLLRAGIEETFRLNPLMIDVYLSEGPGKPGIGLFTTTQVISIPIVLVSVAMLFIIARRPTQPHPIESKPIESNPSTVGVA